MNAIAWRCIAAAALFLATSLAGAAAPTFRISQVYSTTDGSAQYVELTEYAGLDDQHAWKGLSLTITDGGVVKSVTFPADLPTTRTAHMSVLVWPDFDSGLGCIDFWDCPPNPYLDYRGGLATYFLLPAPFVDPRGGTLDFAGADHVAYPTLSPDNTQAWYRDGGFARATTPEGCAAPPCARDPYSIPTVFVQEFHLWPADQFLLTTDEAEIAALITGQIPGWTSTGGGFAAYPLPFGAFDAPVCRFLVPAALGGGHFYSAFASECALLAAPGSGFTMESDKAFYVALPDPATGACASGDPVYRLWNYRSGADHRYLTDKTGRDYLVDVLHWYRSEGYGPDGVAFCAFDINTGDGP